jgi:hypothetical protein
MMMNKQRSSGILTVLATIAVTMLIISLILVLSLFFINYAFAQNSADCLPGFGLDPDSDGGCVPLPDQGGPEIIEEVPETGVGPEIIEEVPETGVGPEIIEEVPETGVGPEMGNELGKLGEGISGKLGGIEEAVVGDKSTLGLEPDILPLAGIIGAIGASVIAVYKVKHRNPKSKSDPSSINVNVITRGGIEE